MSTTLLALRAPSSNRVYSDAAGPLGIQEARWVLGTRLEGTSIRSRSLAGIDHLEITADASREELVRLVSSLSSVLALYEIVEDEDEDEDERGAPGQRQPLLRPIPLAPVLHHSSDLETTLKYPGKTNEQFTALLVNVAAALSEHRDRMHDGRLTLLDPLCGRGTTLSRALRLGLSPIGADLDRRDTDAYRVFLTQWARAHRYPHTADAGRLTVRGRRLGTRFDLRMAPDKKTLKDGGQSLTLLGCDTLELGGILRDGSIDAIVADLPYGVQHGSHVEGGLQRSAIDILAAAAPIWRRLMRTGAGMAIAVNRKTTPFGEVVRTLEDAGLRVVSVEGAFRHRVDQSIDRDVVLAVPRDHPRAEELRRLGHLPVKDL